ncbi:MAG TPA: nitroreductase family deazaflavin-dependent oxidoreductase [Ktedonobacterales bacterium]|nr:nitroreductase family deazaflavin-dependent oxidoreductase [Ktedonobacterales bacterium]
MPLPQTVARFNRRVTNRITGQFADQLPGFGIVIHKGRRSGRMYHTPLNVFRAGNDYIIALTYGAETDWVRNVLAADGCEIVTRGRRIRLAHPRLITDPPMPWAPLPVRLILRATGVTEYMRLTRVAAEGGEPR